MKRNRIGKIFTKQLFPHLQKTADFEKYTEQSLKRLRFAWQKVTNRWAIDDLLRYKT